LYISWGCPWAQRTAIVRQLKRLAGVVSLSYVDDTRDGRGWAFRERRGPDPVNGFTFLAEAYEATEPGYDGHVSVPVLWDLWAYARDVYQHPAFRDTTDFSSFGGLVRGPRPSFLSDGQWRIEVEPYLADWDAPSGRARLG